MMKEFKTLRYILGFIFCAVLLASCGSVKPNQEVELEYDALRIKEEYRKLYEEIPETGISRSGATLRGKVYRYVEEISYEISGMDTIEKRLRYFVYKDNRDKAPLERIRVEHVDLVGPKLGLDTNWVEMFNDPLDIKDVREVEKRVYRKRLVRDSTAEEIIEEDMDCVCQPLNVMLPELSLNCPVRSCPWYFLEVRMGYASYVDKIDEISDKSQTATMLELAFGYRWRHWGFGFALSTGAPFYNSKELLENSEKSAVYRPTGMIHVRYELTDRCVAKKASKLCIDPFIYGQLGLAFDDVSIDLMRVNRKCCEGVETDLPGVDGSFPISYGLGIGVDIPMSSFIDMSVDIGFRSIAFGESISLLGFSNYPTKRRVNMFVMRFGVSL